MTTSAWWMPYTDNREFAAHPRVIVRGSGNRLETADGHELLDVVSGLFCVPAGHSRREIAEAVSAQIATLAYSPPFNHGHPGAFALAERLAAMLPGDLSRIFFASSGSDAVDSALKIALAYHHARGEGQRTRLVGRERGYHGVNFGGISVGGMAPNRTAYGPLVPGALHLPHTALPENRFHRGQPSRGAELAEDLERLCKLHGGDTIAAVIVEPVAGSTGCLPPPLGYLERLREICDAHGILLIFDEVITGFGRMGEAFAADRFAVQPDLLTMAKALTNGAVPMSAVAVREGIYEAIVGAAPEGRIELFHGYTWSAHPVACAAALATLDLYAKEGLFARAKELEAPFLEALFSLEDCPGVYDIRGIGLLGVVELEPESRPGAHGARAIQPLFEAGLLTKVTGDAISLAPAFVSTSRDFEIMAERLREVLRAL